MLRISLSICSSLSARLKAHFQVSEKIWTTESTLKELKSAFYFTLKAFLVIRGYTNFCLDFLVR